MNKLIIRKPILSKKGESNNKQSSECTRCKKPYVIKNVQICNCTGILNWQSSSWEKEAKDIACRAGIDHVAYTYEKICKLLSAQQQEWKEKLRKKIEGMDSGLYDEGDDAYIREGYEQCKGEVLAILK